MLPRQSASTSLNSHTDCGRKRRTLTGECGLGCSSVLGGTSCLKQLSGSGAARRAVADRKRPAHPRFGNNFQRAVIGNDGRHNPCVLAGCAKCEGQAGAEATMQRGRRQTRSCRAGQDHNYIIAEMHPLLQVQRIGTSHTTANNLAALPYLHQGVSICLRRHASAILRVGDCDSGFSQRQCMVRAFCWQCLVRIPP